MGAIRAVHAKQREETENDRSSILVRTEANAPMIRATASMEATCCLAIVLSATTLLFFSRKSYDPFWSLPICACVALECYEAICNCKHTHPLMYIYRFRWLVWYVSHVPRCIRSCMHGCAPWTRSS